MNEKERSSLTHRDGRLVHKAMARQLDEAEQELVEQVAGLLEGWDHPDQLRRTAKRILNLPELRRRLEIAQRYDGAEPLTFRPPSFSDLPYGTYRLVPEQREECRAPEYATCVQHGTPEQREEE